jgi:hypothetical protein
MQCLMQVFDCDGNAQLRGGANFKEHIDWLWLLAWSSSLAPRPPASGAPRSSLPTVGDVVFSVRGDNLALAPLQQAASGNYSASSWSKGVIDCFTKGDDPIWSLRVTLKEPCVSGLRPRENMGFGGPLVWDVSMSFASSSVDFRFPDIKVTQLMPSGAIWDPNEQVCKMFDPNDAVSRLPE